jgi:hypothetical protein
VQCVLFGSGCVKGRECNDEVNCNIIDGARRMHEGLRRQFAGRWFLAEGKDF